MGNTRSPAGWKTFLHPLLFVAAPILFLYSNNIGELPPDEFLQITIICLGAMLFLQLAGRRLSPHPTAFAIGLSIGAFLFFNYGHLYPTSLFIARRIIPTMPYYPKQLAMDLLAHEILLLVLLPVTILSIDRIRRSAFLQKTVTDFLLVFGFLLILTPLLGMLPSLIHPPAAENTADDEPVVHASAENPPPDIYYILLDGYGRKDVLADVFDYDNASFLDGLAQRGFFVAEAAKSNYSQTVLSLTSTWNMDYLDAIAPHLNPDSTNKNLLLPYFRENRVLDQLHAAGYRSYAFASGYPRTEWTGADEFLEKTGNETGLMSSLLIQTTGIRLFESAFSLLNLPFPYPGYQAHRERIEFVFQSLPEWVGRPSPKIIIAHLMAPHPAFVADAEGKDILPRSAYRLADASDFPGTTEDYIAGYRAELTWINREVTRLVDAILAESARPPVIILQADHGPGAMLDWRHPTPEGIHERMRILIALHLPDAGQPRPYAEITPVNLFRLVFDRYLGTDYGLLPDHSWFSSTSYPFRILQEDREIP